MTFGEKLRALRQEKELSMDMVSSLADVSTRTLYNWEHDRSIPKNLDTWNRLAAVLGVRQEELYGDLPHSEFGAHIEAIRKSRGLTRRNLCSRMGVSEKTYYNWSHGTGKPASLAMLSLLADALDVPLEALSGPIKKSRP